MYTWEELIRLYRLTVPNTQSNLQPRYMLPAAENLLQKWPVSKRVIAHIRSMTRGSFDKSS